MGSREVDLWVVHIEMILKCMFTYIQQNREEVHKAEKWAWESLAGGGDPSKEVMIGEIG